MRLRHLLAPLALVLLAACSSPPPRVVASAPPPVVLDPDAACLKDLEMLGVAFQPSQSFGNPEEGGCGVSNAVKVSGVDVPWNRPALMSCALARTMARYQVEVLQPLAQQRFGQPLKRVHHAGTYDCRIQRNNTTAAAAQRGSKGGRLSEHSKGMAIDLMAFELADGTMVSVKRDWREGGAKAAFLKDVARASCNTFNVVLTPNHDRFHQDHLHLDIGPHTLCGY